MKLLTYVLLPFVMAAHALALPEVDQAEVLRLGNHVQHVGVGPRQEAADPLVEALAPPASDADKWFISVLTMQHCPGCVKLKRDWQTSPWLLALAIPSDSKASWAHFNVYASEDESQKFRFAAIQVTAYPTILVQPPRTGKYGDPATVVFQGVYGGDVQKLASEIVRAIRKYVAALEKKRPPREAKVEAEVKSDAGQIGIDPPWQPTPKDDPNAKPILQVNLPQVPPADAPSAFPWGAVIALFTAGATLPATAALAVWLIRSIRAARQASGQPPLVDPAVLERVLKLLEQWAAKQERA